LCACFLFSYIPLVFLPLSCLVIFCLYFLLLFYTILSKDWLGFTEPSSHSDFSYIHGLFLYMDFLEFKSNQIKSAQGTWILTVTTEFINYETWSLDISGDSGCSLLVHNSLYFFKWMTEFWKKICLQFYGRNCSTLMMETIYSTEMVVPPTRLHQPDDHNKILL
jgi:hypothetical protein